MAEGRGLEPRSVMSAGSLAGCFLVQSDAFRVKESGTPFLIQNWWARWESNPQAAGSEPTRYASSLHLPDGGDGRTRTSEGFEATAFTAQADCRSGHVSKLVWSEGVEPSRVASHAPQACASAISPRPGGGPGGIRTPSDAGFGPAAYAVLLRARCPLAIPPAV